jgi:hypothetical protein
MDMVLVHIQIFVVVPLGTAEPGVICTIVLGKFTILSHTYMNRIAYNSGSVCTSRGTCKAPDTCNCNSGYSGISCQSYYCNSILYTSPSVCSAVGTCTASETCSCNSCYTGTYCEFNYCQTGAFALYYSNDAQVFNYDRTKRKYLVNNVVNNITKKHVLDIIEMRTLKLQKITYI